jgi:hypothetical protein
MERTGNDAVSWLLDAEEVESREPLSCDRCDRSVTKLWLIEFARSGARWLVCQACFWETKVAYGVEGADGAPTTAPISEAGREG